MATKNLALQQGLFFVFVLFLERNKCIAINYTHNHVKNVPDCADDYKVKQEFAKKNANSFFATPNKFVNSKPAKEEANDQHKPIINFFCHILFSPFIQILC